MDMKALKDAIKMRKGQGVDIKLIIGGEEPDEMEEEMEKKTSDLAPDGEEAPEEMAEEAMEADALEPIKKGMLAKGGASGEEEEAVMDMKKAHEGYGAGSLMKKALAMMGKK